VTRTPTSFDSAGTCTYVLVTSSGEYVYDPTAKIAGIWSRGEERDKAHLWFSEQSALDAAKRIPWVGAGATAWRGRP
jgi:hypothetical protein